MAAQLLLVAFVTAGVVGAGTLGFGKPNPSSAAFGYCASRGDGYTTNGYYLGVQADFYADSSCSSFSFKKYIWSAQSTPAISHAIMDADSRDCGGALTASVQHLYSMSSWNSPFSATTSYQNCPAEADIYGTFEKYSPGAWTLYRYATY